MFCFCFVLFYKEFKAVERGTYFFHFVVCLFWWCCCLPIFYNLYTVFPDHITSPTCVLLPVKRLTELCHKYDVIVVIDGAHVPGQMEVDIVDIDPDFYTGM